MATRLAGSCKISRSGCNIKVGFTHYYTESADEKVLGVPVPQSIGLPFVGEFADDPVRFLVRSGPPVNDRNRFVCNGIAHAALVAWVYNGVVGRILDYGARERIPLAIGRLQNGVHTALGKLAFHLFCC